MPFNPLIVLLTASTLVAGGVLGLAALDTPKTSGDAPAARPSDAAHEAGAHEASLHNGSSGDPDDHEHQHGAQGMKRPHFPAGQGSVPSADEAQGLEQRSVIKIAGDDGFVPSNGVREGSGTLDDPFVISGYYVTGDLFLQDTDACVLIKENYVGGQLSLNWNGQCVHVHHNFVRDLRVNENIRRDGYATGGLLELNKIEYIGQLRHYDGEFRHNVVGPRSSQSVFDPVQETVPYLFAEDPRVANVDGFNQGLIHHTTFHGSVDLDFHGHHHGTGFFASHSHYHGDNETRLAEHVHDHTQRWTSVFFTDNRVIDDVGYGLRYEDRNHAGDDRTAASEQVDELDLDHFHRTHIVIARNVIDGGQLWVDVFNADDDHHEARNDGTLELVGNTVILKQRVRDGPAGVPIFGPHWRADSALRVIVAKEVELLIADTTIRFEPAQRQAGALAFLGEPEAEPAAIDLDGFRRANVTIRNVTTEGFVYGVKAHEFDTDTNWRLADVDFGGARYDVWYDESVENPPRKE